MSRLSDLIDRLVSEASTNNEMDNRPALARARKALETEIDRLVSEARKQASKEG